MFRALISIALLAVGLSTGPGHAADVGSREEAIAMVRRVQDKFKKDGPDATFRAITQKEFNDRDLYPFVFDLNGLNVGTGGNSVLVGKNLISLRDQDGKYQIQEMIAVAKGAGAGWVGYRWPHPVTRKLEDKSSYVERMGEYMVGVGVYLQPAAPSPRQK